MAPTRVDALALELGLGVGALIDLCDDLGVVVEGRSTVLTTEQVRQVRAASGARDGADGVEQSKGTGTRRERHQESGTGTRREGDPGHSSGWLQLPAAFAARFEMVRELRHGGEGFVVVVRALEDGQLSVLKGYHHGFDIDTTSLEILTGRDADLADVVSGEPVRPAHIVQVVEFGELDDGTFYELQEYCPAGSLRDLLDRGDPLDFDVALAELVGALAHVHDLGIVHRDVKPENVLVRTQQPLDLVLADFGLVRRVAGSVRRTTRAGTAEYSPPEGVTERVEVSPAWDWWSLGMVLAELSAGVHPLALPDGTFPSPGDMRLELTQRPVDLSAITDPRQRRLCSGLLVRDRRRRWGVAEVTSWIAGGEPPIDDVEPGPDLDAAILRSTQTVLFGGVDLDDPASLAAALQAQWGEGIVRLFQEPDPALVEETIAFCESRGLAAAASLVREQPAGDDVPRQYARLLAALDPELRPTFDGIDLRPAGLEAAARRVIETSDEELAVKLETVRRAQILRAWRHLPGMESAPGIVEAWTELRSDFDGLGAAVLYGLSTAERHKIAAWLLLVAVDRRHLDDLERRQDALDVNDVEEITWFASLAADTRPVAVVAFVVTYPRASAEAHELREQRRQAEQAAVRREARERRTQRRRAIEAERAARRAKANAGAESFGVVGLIVGLIVFLAAGSTVSNTSGFGSALSVAFVAGLGVAAGFAGFGYWHGILASEERNGSTRLLPWFAAFAFFLGSVLLGLVWMASM